MTPAAVLDTLPDPATETAYRHQLAREAYDAGLADGYRIGYRLGAHDYSADWQQTILPILERVADSPAPADRDRRRWHVCCRPCRRTGHQPGCPDCEDRTRDTYSDPHPDDYPGGAR